MWPHHCVEIWSNVSIVFELLCAWISWWSADLGANTISRPLTTAVELSSVRKLIKLWQKDKHRAVFQILFLLLLSKSRSYLSVFRLM